MFKRSLKDSKDFKGDMQMGRGSVDLKKPDSIFGYCTNPTNPGNYRYVCD
jgi:hypothetical protein